MDAMQVLPDDILWKQVCQECYNYLSVPPIFINSQGESICGRCVGLSGDGQKTKSLFNIVASGFHFRCVNHFNGCTKILAFEEVQSHEKECFYEPQECIFCPFSGNLSQIFNHAAKIHPDNVSFDGVIPLPLFDHSLEKKYLLSVKDNHLLVLRMEVTEDLISIRLKLLTREVPLNINQYALKFYKPGDHESSSDYGLFSVNLENTIDKPKEQLAKIFGLANIRCQILMDTFTFEEKEFDLQRRILDVRRSEEHVMNLERKLQMEGAELLQQRESYDLANEVIKTISCHFFKCCKCQKTIFEEVFFCPKIHCYCKSCLSSFCGVCNVVREFSKLSSLEKFSVKCDWPGCDVNIGIKNFWNHKIGCRFRPYKCPLQNCSEIILSVDKLMEHWHANSPTLIAGGEVICEKYGCEEYYWIVNSDIYRLLINFDDKIVQVYVEEHSVLQDNVKFECQGFYDDEWYTFQMSRFCGRYQINTQNCVSSTRRRYNVICSRLKVVSIN